MSEAKMSAAEMSAAETRSVHTSAPLGVHIILVERSQDESGVHLGSARCADYARRAKPIRSVYRLCSSSEAETTPSKHHSKLSPSFP